MQITLCDVTSHSPTPIIYSQKLFYPGTWTLIIYPRAFRIPNPSEQAPKNKTIIKRGNKTLNLALSFLGNVSGHLCLMCFKLFSHVFQGGSQNLWVNMFDFLSASAKTCIPTRSHFKLIVWRIAFSFESLFSWSWKMHFFFAENPCAFSGVTNTNKVFAHRN